VWGTNSDGDNIVWGTIVGDGANMAWGTEPRPSTQVEWYQWFQDLQNDASWVALEFFDVIRVRDADGARSNHRGGK
jgi:hypothetical protein